MSKLRAVLKFLDDALRHPVTLLLLGFALTAGLGNYIQDRQHQEDAARTELTNTSVALNRIRQAISEFVSRAVLYGRNEKNDSEQQLRRDVDEAWVKADSAIQDNSYAVAAAFPMPDGKVRDELRQGFAALRVFLRNTDILSKDGSVARTSIEDGKTNPMVLNVELCVSSFLTEYEQVLFAGTPRAGRLKALAKQGKYTIATLQMAAIGIDCPRPLAASHAVLLRRELGISEP